VLVAAANARKTYENEIATLYDLRPEQRPDLQSVDVITTNFVDAVTPRGLRFLRLPLSYPRGVGWKRCQQIAKRLYGAGEAGVACRSAAAIAEVPGEELAIFDSSLRVVKPRSRVQFAEWYPVEAGLGRRA
jgi:hypothetical protein